MTATAPPPVDGMGPAVVNLARDVAAAVVEIAAMMPPAMAERHLVAAATLKSDAETAWAEQIDRWSADAARRRAEARAARGGMSVYEAEIIRKGDD